MRYFKIDIELLDVIEKEFSVKLNLLQANVFSLINSYNSVGQKCTMSQETMGKYLRCSYKTISRVTNKLKADGLINIYRPPEQMEDKLALTYHINKEVKDFIKKYVTDKLSEEKKQRDKLSTYTNKDKVSTYTNKSRVSEETSFGDCSSSREKEKEKEDWEIALLNDYPEDNIKQKQKQ